MKRISALFISVGILLSAVGCADGETAPPEPDKTAALSENQTEISQGEVAPQTVEDYYVKGIPVLENNFYRLVTGADIFGKAEPHVEKKGEDGFTFYKDDNLYWIFQCCYNIPIDGQTPYGIIVCDEENEFGIGLHPGMTTEELDKFSEEKGIPPYKVFEKSEISEEDFWKTHLLNHKSGLLELFPDYDSIYFFEFTGFGSDEASEAAQALNIPTPYCYGFICFIKDGKIIAIATDLPTAG